MIIKSFTYRILALLTAGVMIVSSFSFTVNSHYCMGILKDRSINSAADTCMPKTLTLPANGCSDDLHKIHDDWITEYKMLMKDRGCCNDSQMIIESEQDDFQVQHHVSFMGVDVDFLHAYIITQFKLWPQVQVKVPHLNYKPPLLCKNIPILVQSFLC